MVPIELDQQLSSKKLTIVLRGNWGHEFIRDSGGEYFSKNH